MTTDRRALIRRGLFLILPLLLVAGLAWGLRDAPAREPAGRQWVTVQPEPLEQSVGLVGRIEAERTRVLTAPFAGRVAELPVALGQRVKSGQLLLRMDTGETEVQQREALASLLRARRTLQELEDWDSGEEMTRARRTLRSAELALASSEKKLAQTRALYERGIIPRNELEDLEQQARLQRLDREAAERDLARSRNRGSGEYLQIARMELTNAEARHGALQALLEAREVRAPFAGILVAPPGSGTPEDATRGPVQAGATVTQGAPLFGVAGIERLRIVARVSELDVNQLREGLPVRVEGDGFEGEALQGTVSVVGGQALAGNGQGGAQFEVVVAVADLDEDQLARVRLGMSARLSIQVYSNPSALVLPPRALRNEDGRWWVDYRATPEAAVQRLQVRPGRATRGGIEVFDLQPGQVALDG
ncbi:efflux RND transporter periplasmic adaptor subunit [Metapseudomonas otitidis]